MSNPVSALGNASDVSGLAEVREIGPLGMLSLRGDLTDKVLIKAVGSFPSQGHCTMSGDTGVAWMSPDELLVICPYADALAKQATLQGALASKHALIANVSDARAVFEVSGTETREVLAKLAPVDIAPQMFAPGQFRRTRFAQVPAAFWMVNEQTARVICFRSVAQYMFDVLNVAAQAGSEVNHF